MKSSGGIETPSGRGRGVVEANLDVVRIADAHQFDVVLEELDVAAERDDLASRVVEHVAHHLRELDDGILGALGVDVNQRVDVVERVHEEVRVNLVLEVVHLGLHVLALELLHLLLVANRLVHELDARVGAGHEERQHDVPVELQVGERRLAVLVEGLLLGEEQRGGEVLVVEVHGPEDRDDEE